MLNLTVTHEGAAISDLLEYLEGYLVPALKNGCTSGENFDITGTEEPVNEEA
jgi:hypothetical protein